MALLMVDVASYQYGLDVGLLKAAGTSVINLKISHGLTRKSVMNNTPLWAAQARDAGIGVSTFHWLDKSATGDAQARYAYARMVELGDVSSTAHVVDTEADATWTIYRDYVVTMMSLLGRKIVTYSGDWWLKPRGWPAADLSPWLHAAPNAGYLEVYPGDASPHWRANYGGYKELAIMQYTVAPISGVRCSMSVIRKPELWAAMCGRS